MDGVFPKGSMVGTVIKVLKTARLDCSSSSRVLPAVQAAAHRERSRGYHGRRRGKKLTHQPPTIAISPGMRLFLIFFYLAIFVLLLQTTLLHLYRIGPFVPDLTRIVLCVY